MQSASGKSMHTFILTLKHTNFVIELANPQNVLQLPQNLLFKSENLV